MSEKRKGRRVRRRLVVHYGETELNHTAFTNDVSVTGMFVVSGYLPAIDARLHLQVEGGDGRVVYFEGIVTRQKRVPTQLMRTARGGFAVRLLTTAELIVELVERGSASAPAWSAPDTGKFRLIFPAIEPFRKMYEEQLRRGGIVVPGEIVGGTALERDALVTIELSLAFASGTPSPSFQARVLQMLPASGVSGSCAMAFVDSASVMQVLGPFVAAASP